MSCAACAVRASGVRSRPLRRARTRTPEPTTMPRPRRARVGDGWLEGARAQWHVRDVALVHRRPSSPGRSVLSATRGVGEGARGELQPSCRLPVREHGPNRGDLCDQGAFRPVALEALDLVALPRRRRRLRASTSASRRVPYAPAACPAVRGWGPVSDVLAASRRTPDVPLAGPARHASALNRGLAPTGPRGVATPASSARAAWPLSAAGRLLRSTACRPFFRASRPLGQLGAATCGRW
jgi:hypothetical protein